MGTTQQKVFRFYRSNLETIVWDKDNDRPLAEFVNGQFYTKDAKIAATLTAMGYVEIPLDLQEPPDVFFQKGKSLGEGEHAQIIPKGMTEEVALQQEQVKAQQEALAQEAAGDNDGPSPADIALANSKAQQEAKTQKAVGKPSPKKKAASAASKKGKLPPPKTRRTKSRRTTKPGKKKG